MKDRKINYELNPIFLNEYLDYLYNIKQYSNYYIINTNSTCRQFLEFINIKLGNRVEDIKDITVDIIRKLSKEDIYDYIYYLVSNNTKTSSIYVKTNRLRSFFKYLYKLHKNYHLFLEPTKDLKNLNIKKCKERKLPKILSLDECKKLLSFENYNLEKEMDVRDLCILTLFLNTGLRLSELISLNINEIDFAKKQVAITGKGNKERIIHFNNFCIKLLNMYLKFRRKKIVKNPKEINALFISNKGDRICSSSVERLLKKRLLKANINTQGITVHSLRHSFATIIYRENENINILSEILGHSSINTTKIYTKLHSKDVEETMNLNPLSDFKINIS